MALIAGKARRAIRHALAIMDDKVNFAGKVDLGAHLLSDAPPALETVGAMWAVWHAAALVGIMLAGGTRHVVPRFGTAPQALWVTALARICAGVTLAFQWACWKTHTHKISRQSGHNKEILFPYSKCS